MLTWACPQGLVPASASPQPLSAWDAGPGSQGSGLLWHRYVQMGAKSDTKGGAPKRNHSFPWGLPRKLACGIRPNERTLKGLWRFDPHGPPLGHTWQIPGTGEAGSRLTRLGGGNAISS